MIILRSKNVKNFPNTVESRIFRISDAKSDKSLKFCTNLLKSKFHERGIMESWRDGLVVTMVTAAGVLYSALYLCSVRPADSPRSILVFRMGTIGGYIVMCTVVSGFPFSQWQCNFSQTLPSCHCSFKHYSYMDCIYYEYTNVFAFCYKKNQHVSVGMLFV